MSSYFSSFNYLGTNSREQGLVIAHFDADQGEVDTFLGMEPVYTESAYGSRRLDYGAKHNNVATFRVTMIKPDGTDLSVAEVRKHLRWLTGARQNSPLELTEHFAEEFISDGTKVLKLTNACDHVFHVYVENTLLTTDQWNYDKTTNSITFTSTQTRGSAIKISYNQIKYYFIGRITNAWQYKMDSRTVGLIFEFTSISPWAYSAKQTVSTAIGDGTKVIVNNDTDDLYGYTPVNVTFHCIKNNLIPFTKPMDLSKFLIDDSGASAMGTCVEYNGGMRVVNTQSNLRVWLTKLTGKLSVSSGQRVTVSFKYQMLAGNSPVQVQMNWYRSAEDTAPGYADSDPYEATEPHRFPQMVKMTDDGWCWVRAIFVVPSGYTLADCAIRSGQDFKSYDCEYVVKECKVEYGATATIWAPHLNDPGFDSLKIVNTNIQETSLITDIVANEIVTISDNMMITSDKPSKIFGNTFNFVFPRLIAGENNFLVDGYGNLTFEYVYAIKIGDCAMDVNANLDSMCYDDGEQLN